MFLKFCKNIGRGIFLQYACFAKIPQHCLELEMRSQQCLNSGQICQDISKARDKKINTFENQIIQNQIICVTMWLTLIV